MSPCGFTAYKNVINVSQAEKHLWQALRKYQEPVVLQRSGGVFREQMFCKLCCKCVQKDRWISKRKKKPKDKLWSKTHMHTLILPLECWIDVSNPYFVCGIHQTIFPYPFKMFIRFLVISSKLVYIYTYIEMIPHKYKIMVLSVYA